MTDARMKALFAEELPTGKFGGEPWRPSRPARRPRHVTTLEEAAHNAAVLSREVAAHDAAQRAAAFEGGEAA